MKLAICDDNKNQLHSIAQMLERYVTPEGEKVRYDLYGNALDLVSNLSSGRYDALLMDILMPGLNGIEAARDIRQINEDIPILFLTSSPEFAVDSYRVHAFDYLMKPVDEAELFKGLEYVEINNRTLLFHLIDGETKALRGKLSDYEENLLSQPNFLKIHRSYVINMDHMKSLNKNSFETMTGKEIPISRNLLTEVHTQYVNYLHSAIRQ